jgi:hypothetical protein
MATRIETVQRVLDGFAPLLLLGLGVTSAVATALLG